MYLRKVLLLQKCLKYYAANGKKEERTVRFMDRIGVDALKQAVL
jgi:NAD(P)H-nitrite reductase large subunit